MINVTNDAAGLQLLVHTCTEIHSASTSYTMLDSGPVLVQEEVCRQLSLRRFTRGKPRHSFSSIASRGCHLDAFVDRNIAQLTN